jgi:hypothetical protein
LLIERGRLLEDHITASRDEHKFFRDQFALLVASNAHLTGLVEVLARASDSKRKAAAISPDAASIPALENPAATAPSAKEPAAKEPAVKKAKISK